MDVADYDGRTALHVAAAEGHFEIVKFLLEVVQVNPEPQDRWGFTPYQEAITFGHTMTSEYFQTRLVDTSPCGKDHDSILCHSIKCCSKRFFS